MITFIKYIRKHIPIIWRIIELCNRLFVKLIYGNKIDSSVKEALDKYSTEYKIKEIKISDAKALELFFKLQPNGFDEFFKPHGFDEESIKETIKNEYIRMFTVNKENKIIGYFFIRFFANGKAFRGKIVDINYRGKGIAKMMGSCVTEIVFKVGFRLMATVSKKNVASINSSRASNKICIIKELENDYIYVEYLPKE